MQEAKESDWRYKKLKKEQAGGLGACMSIFNTYKRTCPFSDNLRDLIDGMLTIDVSKRLSVAAVLQHPWILSPPTTMPQASDRDGDVVYRGAGFGDEDEFMDEEFTVPEDAVKLCRQPAQRAVPMDVELDAIA